jgi:hypothetical protein
MNGWTERYVKYLNTVSVKKKHTITKIMKEQNIVQMMIQDFLVDIKANVNSSFTKAEILVIICDNVPIQNTIKENKK